MREKKKQENRFVFFQLDEENGILMNGEKKRRKEFQYLSLLIFSLEI